MQIAKPEVFSCRLDSLKGEVLLNIMAETSVSLLLSIFKTFFYSLCKRLCSSDVPVNILSAVINTSHL